MEMGLGCLSLGVGAGQMAIGIGPQSKSAQMTHQISVQGAGDKRPCEGLGERMKGEFDCWKLFPKCAHIILQTVETTRDCRSIVVSMCWEIPGSSDHPHWQGNIVERLLIASDLYLVNWDRWWVDIGGHQVH